MAIANELPDALPDGTSERFWAKVGPRQEGQCWIWTGGLCSHGYGQFWSVGARYRANRFVLFLERGVRPPRDQVVRHTCDNPPCVNPDHLIIGTHADNAADMVERGRHPSKRKTHCHRGHALSGDNLLMRKGGWRQCRACQAERFQNFKQRRAKTALAALKSDPVAGDGGEAK
jgi:hypothetical protein